MQHLRIDRIDSGMEVAGGQKIGTITIHWLIYLWYLFILKFINLWLRKVYKCPRITIQDLFIVLVLYSIFLVFFFHSNPNIELLFMDNYWLFKHIDSEDTTKTCSWHGLVLIGLILLAKYCILCVLLSVLSSFVRLYSQSFFFLFFHTFLKKKKNQRWNKNDKWKLLYIFDVWYLALICSSASSSHLYVENTD